MIQCLLYSRQFNVVFKSFSCYYFSSGTAFMMRKEIFSIESQLEDGEYTYYRSATNHQSFFVVAFIRRCFFIQILNKLNKFIPIHFSITFCFYTVKMRKQKSNQNVEYKAIRKELICDISALRSYLLPCINSIEGFFHFHCIVKCSINC